MKAIQCVEWGAPDKLILADLPLPEPGPGQVRIRIAAAGVNFPDALIVQKKYQLQPKLPFVPGTEVAGTVDAVGEGVRHLKLGGPRHRLCRRRRVCGIRLRAGCFGGGDTGRRQ